LLLKEHEGRGMVSLLGFYARRARRILPAAMAVIVGTVLLAYFMVNYITYGTIAADGRWASLFAANIHFANVGNDYFALGTPPSPLQHFWSLAVEEQFYLAWPLVVLVIGLTFRSVSIRTRILVVSAVVVGVSLWWSVVETTSNPIWAYYSPFTRAWELGLGAALACVAPQLKVVPKVFGSILAWFGLFSIVLSAILFTDATTFPGFAALLPVLGTVAVIGGGAMAGSRRWSFQAPRGVGSALSLGGLALASAGIIVYVHDASTFNGLDVLLIAVGLIALIAATLAATPSTALLGLAPVRSVGRVSYGWYLLHYPLMILMVGAVWTHRLSVTENLIIAALTLVLAYRMYERLERPVRRSAFLARHPWASVGLGAALVSAAFWFCWTLHPSLHHIWGT
jgi:peptidoglycan/LPS O-acetylase OafA/YrhL